jgi:hypothetical protein
MLPSGLFGKEQQSWLREETSAYIFVALLAGMLLILASYLLPEPGASFKPELFGTIRKSLEEFGVVLVSVWGVSLFYEKFLAARHFNRFHENLRALIRQGETNAAVCENLGILEIHSTRRSYENRHSFAQEASSITAGDVVRITGRSLIFSMYASHDLQRIVENGAELYLCLLDPTVDDSPLDYLSGYSPEETKLAIFRFLRSIKPWLQTSKPMGTVEIRFHRIHLMDSLLEIKRLQLHHFRVAWDLNFSEGTEQRQVFYLDGDRLLGRNLTSARYQLIWDRAMPKLLYKDQRLHIDELSPRSNPEGKRPSVDAPQ